MTTDSEQGISIPSEVQVNFESPSVFTLDGPGVNKWRKDIGVRIPGAEFSKLFKDGRWDGIQYPGLRDKRGILRFSRGILRRVLTDLPASITAPPPPSPEIPHTIPEGLRDYQEEALRLIFEKKWGRIALATNAGKGAIIALAAKAFAVSGRTSLVLCDEISVFQALSEQIQLWALRSPDLIEAGASVIPKPGAIVLAMVPTLYRRKSREWLEWFQTVDAVFLDEADKASAATWLEILRRLTHTHYRIGFSGTFFDEETPSELILSEYIGPVLQRVKNTELIARGISARPFVELIPYSHPHYRIPDYWKLPGPSRRQAIFNAGVITNEERHQLILSLLDPNVPNAIIINFIEQGRELLKVLPNSMFLSGDAPKATREGVLAEFKKGSFQNLIVSKILDRGTNDLGHTIGLIFASGQGSNRQTLQRVGRGLRRADGKQFLFLKDILDRGHKYFDDQSRKRVVLYNEEGFEITIRS